MSDEQNKPTIDERLEALTMNLELMGHRMEGFERTMATMERSMGKALETVQGLVRVAELHEHRISGLEDGGR